VGTWFHETIIDKNRLALFLCFLAFTVTFVVTRVITRNIRAGRGPFHDNVSHSGMHVHHAVPGLVLLVTGAFMSVATAGEHPWTEISAVMIGIGTSLVLDEFALILHLSDVYWAKQGRISVEVVSLTIACLGLSLVGFSPNLFTGDADTTTLLSTTVAAGIHIAAVVVCVLKGRYEFAVFGAFIVLVAGISAVLIARPDSLWAKRFYDEARMAKATQRAQRFEARWGRYFDAVSDFVAGKPTEAELAERVKLRGEDQAPAAATG